MTDLHKIRNHIGRASIHVSDAMEAMRKSAYNMSPAMQHYSVRRIDEYINGRRELSVLPYNIDTFIEFVESGKQEVEGLINLLDKALEEANKAKDECKEFEG